MILRGSWMLIVALVAACSPYAPDLGPHPFLCGTSTPKCPDGYTCEGTICTNHHGPDAGSGSGCTMPFSGTLASWTFAGQPGSQTSDTAASNAPGLVAGNLTRASALTAAAAANSISASNWPTGPLDATKYYAVTITPPPGCSLSVSAMAIDALSSGTGPASASVGTSSDGFVQTASVSTTSPSMPSVVVSGFTSALEIRVFGFSASATSGTMRLQNTFSVTGSLQ